MSCGPPAAALEALRTFPRTPADHRYGPVEGSPELVEAIRQAPFYFNHDMAIALAGCRTVAVPTDDRYHLQPDAIRAAITARTRAVVTITPNNPSGAVYPESALRAIVRA